MSQDISEKVLDTIKARDLKMRPRWYFILRDVLGVVAIVIVLLMAVYLASFIVFVLHQNGAWFVPVFGLDGWFALFNALPWMLILLSAAFIIILAVLVKRYDFAYQWPMVYSILAAFFLVGAACLFFIQSSFYNEFFSSSIAQDVPFLGLYYPGIGPLSSNEIHRGAVVMAGDNGFVFRDSTGAISNVIISSGTIGSFGAVFTAGESIVVFGDRSVSGTIYAVGVAKLGN